MSNQNVAAPGAETFVHGTVLSVMFNTQVEKRAGGTYPGTTLFFQSSRGQPESQSWAQQIIDDARNIEIRNALVALQAAPGAAFTLHKVKNDKGYWNVTRIDMGHVEGNRSSPAGGQPVAPGGAPVAAAPGFGNDDNKRRSKEDCVRGEAIQAAANALPRGTDAATIIALAEQFAAYIVPAAPAAPAAAPVAAAPVAAPAPAVAPVAAPAPVAAAPAPVAAVAPVAAAPAPVAAAPVAAAPVPPAPIPTIAPAAAPVAAAPAPAPAPAPVAAVAAAPAPPVAAAPAPAPVVAQPAAVPDGF